MKLNAAALSLFALPILPCSAWRSRAHRETIEVFTTAMEDNVHPDCLRLFIAKPEGVGVRNLEISEDCIDDTDDLFDNSEALQDILIDSVDEVTECHPTGRTSIACFVHLPESLVNETVALCEAAGGHPVSVPDFTGTCTGRYDLESTVSFQDFVECVAPSCDPKDFIALESTMIMQALEDELRLVDDLLSDITCSVDGDGGLRGAVDGAGGLCGGAIAGIVITSVLGAALM